MKTLVLGASTTPTRYSNMAVRLLRGHGHEVLAVGKTRGEVSSVPIEKDFPADKDIDTITMYLNPDHQKSYYENILAAHPRRIIFNPGAENSELAGLAEKEGILTDYACTLVLLNTGQY